MRTQQPISFIWFGSESFLKDQLSCFVVENKVDFWCFIHHKKEEEEKKDHFHVFAMPSSVIDSDYFKAHFVEADPNNVKPVKINRIETSKWYDWYWYGLHDPRYLSTKGIDPKRYVYSPNDIVRSDEDMFIEMKLNTPKVKNSADPIREAVINRVPFVNLVDSGVVPIHLIRPYEKAYYELQRIYDPDYAKQCRGFRWKI